MFGMFRDSMSWSVISITSLGVSGLGIMLHSASVPGVVFIQSQYFRPLVPHGQLDINTNQ